jgi:hypothetical protein
MSAYLPLGHTRFRMRGSAPVLLGALVLNVPGSARDLACLLHRGEPSFSTPQPLADNPRCKSVIQELPGAHLDAYILRSRSGSRSSDGG